MRSYEGVKVRINDTTRANLQPRHRLSRGVFLHGRHRSVVLTGSRFQRITADRAPQLETLSPYSTPAPYTARADNLPVTRYLLTYSESHSTFVAGQDQSPNSHPSTDRSALGQPSPQQTAL